jgi:hypothetical protein
VRGGGGKRGEVAQIMYTHVSKCKNDEIKFKKRKHVSKCKNDKIKLKKYEIKVMY